MPDQRFNAMVSQHCRTFYELYQDLARGIFETEQKAGTAGRRRGQSNLHYGEFGAHRELVVQYFIRPFTPQRFVIADGFVVSQHGETTGQCDIIVAERDRVPFAGYRELGPFYPVEAVAAVGEVKSDLDRSERLWLALKQLDSRLEHWDAAATSEVAASATFSFLICSRLRGKDSQDVYTGQIALEETVDIVKGAVSSKAISHIPDAILSLGDGLILYNAADSSAVNAKGTIEYLSPSNGSTTHLKRFLAEYYGKLNDYRGPKLSIRDYYQESHEDVGGIVEC